MREQPLTLRWTTLVSLVAKKGHVFTMSRFTGLCWVCIHGASTFSPIILVSSLVGTVALTKLGGRWCYKHFGTASGTSNQTTACFRRQKHWHDAFLLWPTGMKVSHTVGCHLWYKAGSQLFRFWDQTTRQFQGAPVSASIVFLYMFILGGWATFHIYMYIYICICSHLKSQVTKGFLLQSSPLLLHFSLSIQWREDPITTQPSVDWWNASTFQWGAPGIGLNKNR